MNLLVGDPYRIDAGLYDRLMGIYLDREAREDQFVADGRLSDESEESLLEAAVMALSDIRELPAFATTSLEREARLFKKCIDDFDAIIKGIEQAEAIASAGLDAPCETPAIDDEPAEDLDV
jgi:hypothetical protein